MESVVWTGECPPTTCHLPVSYAPGLEVTVILMVDNYISFITIKYFCVQSMMCGVGGPLYHMQTTN